MKRKALTTASRAAVARHPRAAATAARSSSVNKRMPLSPVQQQVVTCAVESVSGETKKRKEKIQVAVHLRPLSTKKEKATTDGRLWRVVPSSNSIEQMTTNMGKPLSEHVKGRNYFTYNKTFGEDASTKDVYNAAAKRIAKSAVAGVNGTVFAYGQTVSGKTFTMQGSIEAVLDPYTTKITSDVS